MTKRYILTGTPGAGKTTLIRFLEVKGFFVVDEAATDVIALQQALGILTPWESPSFIDHISALQTQRQLQTAALPLQTQFFDRSPLDTLALSIYLDFPLSSLLSRELERIERENCYQKQVFFIENLGFCQPTEIRKISFSEALRFEKIHEEVYAAWNYQCVKIAPKSIEARVDDILKHCFQETFRTC